jgi:exodeoxyribonuclease VII large subunit
MAFTPADSPSRPVRERDVYTVSRLNREARGLVEGSLGSIWLEGEVSNFARPGSGHWYFSLKDDAAQVRCAMFRQRNAGLGMVPKDGMQVLVRARASVYEARGEFQLIVDHLEESGEGELRRRFERLKRQLAAEGLFDSARKRPLPRLPRRIGVVTSATGAALRDILQVLRRRFAAVPVVLYPVPVQGAGSAAQIAAAIALASARAEVDVLVVGRGGGSLEDLWSFNEEVVARAIVGCAIPVVSAVGHEVDVTIADLAADVRAPTPSAAAELIVPDAAEWLRSLAAAEQRLAGAWRRRLLAWRDGLDWAAGRLAQLHPARAVERQQQRLDDLDLRLGQAVRTRLSVAGHRLAARRAELLGLSPRARLSHLGQRLAVLQARLSPALAARLELARSRFLGTARALHAVSPLATLERGYAIALRLPDGAILTASAQAPAGTDVELRLSKGRLRARVTASNDD